MFLLHLEIRELLIIFVKLLLKMGLELLSVKDTNVQWRHFHDTAPNQWFIPLLLRNSISL